MIERLCIYRNPYFPDYGSCASDESPREDRGMAIVCDHHYELVAQEEWTAAEKERILLQLSALEVPGFHARTVVDDIVGKLYALRNHLKVNLPEDLPGLLDDLEERVEALMELAFDPETPATLDILPATCSRQGLSTSGSSTLSWCSCGMVNVEELLEKGK